MENTKKEKTKKALNIVLNVLLYSFLALCVVFLVASITMKKKGGTMSIFGYEMRIVLTGSMEKSEYVDVSEYKIKDIPVNSVVIIKKVPGDAKKASEFYSKLKVGDVLTFQYRIAYQPTVITHRIVEIVPNAAGGYTISLQGDNRSSPDGAGTQIINTADVNSLDRVIGKVTVANHGLGVILNGMKQPVVMMLIIVVPCMLIIVLQVVRIFQVSRSDKAEKEKEEKEKVKEEDKKKTDEIEELKRQLAALQQKERELAETERALSNPPQEKKEASGTAEKEQPKE